MQGKQFQTNVFSSCMPCVEEGILLSLMTEYCL